MNGFLPQLVLVEGAMLGGLSYLLFDQALPPLDLTLPWQIALPALAWFPNKPVSAVRLDPHESGCSKALALGHCMLQARWPNHEMTFWLTPRRHDQAHPAEEILP